ncbi:MAG TPA: FAD-dependent monooxygenase [Burkholderiaceae bacterium]|nr:FAD-dependent monooxygenase [Burkholderiaceae bacterium]
MISRSPLIAIVGAGIGGLTAALALLRRGFRVRVFEQADRFEDVGAGLQISANGTRLLFSLGLESPLLARAARPMGKQIRLWNTGQTWKLFDLGAESVRRYGFPYLMMHRADLHSALVDGVARLDPDAICNGMRYVGHANDDDAVLVRFDTGLELRCDALIGADGVHSQVRSNLFGSGRPWFTGCMAWRGLVPVDRLPPVFREPVGTNWVGPGAHVITYPVRAGELVNFVGVVERDDWKIESWRSQGTVQECAADFEGWHPDVQALIRGTGTPYKWALLGRDPMTNWSRGRVTLLGDACHPTLPFLAQGAMMAIEDAIVLARCLQSSPHDPGRAFRLYEAARMERTSLIVTRSSENARRFHNPALAHADGAADYVSREWTEQKVQERYDWLFEYDASSVDIGDGVPSAVAGAAGA